MQNMIDSIMLYTQAGIASLTFYFYLQFIKYFTVKAFGIPNDTSLVLSIIFVLVQL